MVKLLNVDIVLRSSVSLYMSSLFQTVRVSSVVDDHLVTQDITEDPDRNTVLIVVGDVKGFKDFKTSVNLHDFNTVIMLFRRSNKKIF